MLGLFINTVPIRFRTHHSDEHPAGPSFDKWLKTIQSDASAIREREYLPLAEIQAVSPLRSELIHHIMTVENFPLGHRLTHAHRETDTGMGFRITDYSLYARTGYELNIIVVIEECLRFNFMYDPSVYDGESMERITRHLSVLVDRVLSQPDAEVSRLAIITEDEKREIIVEFNNTDAEWPEDKTVTELFELQVERTPDRTAFVGPSGEVVSFGEINRRAGYFAFILRVRGVSIDVIVAVMVERSLDMMVAILGILKAGGAYLPIDPHSPPERLRYMLADSRARLLVAAGKEVLPGELENPCEVLFMDEMSFSVSRIDRDSLTADVPALAYVIYTSGTTGRPKGAMLEHRSLVNRLNWMQKRYPIGPGDTVLQKTTYTFDVSVWEILWWGITGSRLCLLVPGGEKDPAVILDVIRRHRVTVMHFVPSMMTAFLDFYQNDGRPLTSLKQVFASGEALSHPLTRQFHQLIGKPFATRLTNLYGPTEAAIDVTFFDCPQNESPPVIPIGKPVDNTAIYILNRDGHLQPVGVPGELHIAGVQLARGYMNRPELTAEKFVKIAHSSWLLAHRKNKDKNSIQEADSQSFPMSYELTAMSLFYKTGDLSRWLADGNIQYLGRIDHQVKIRGFRIELGEIENRITKHDSVREAAVVLKEHTGDSFLCAYVVPVFPETRIGDLKLSEFSCACSARIHDSVLLRSNGELSIDIQRETGPAVASRTRKNPRRFIYRARQ